MNEDGLNSECCCSTAGPETLGYTCADKKIVFTKREQEVLEKIREASLQARAVKERMRGASPDDAAMAEAERELDRLRQLRENLELERLAAAEERMRLLGHI